MRDLLRQFGAVPLALAAYNAGPAPVSRCGCVPPFPETQAYVADILGLLNGAGDALGRRRRWPRHPAGAMTAEPARPRSAARPSSRGSARGRASRSAPSASSRCTMRYSDVGSTPSSVPISRTVMPGRALTMSRSWSRRPLVRARRPSAVRGAVRSDARAGGGSGAGVRACQSRGVRRNDAKALCDLLELAVLVDQRAQLGHAPRDAVLQALQLIDD